MTAAPRITRNDWSSVRAPDLNDWQPTLSVSVVIPAYNCQASLDLTLAALSRQTYPAALMEVVVVDDGSEPPLALPAIRPENCRLIRAPGSGWGTAHAAHAGVLRSSGEVIQRLDADMVTFPDHVAAQARWHHLVSYAVTLGSKRFVDVTPGSPRWPTPEDVAKSASVEELFELDASEPHDYIERIVQRTDQLRGGDHLTFMAHVGATASLRRELYEAAGGLDVRLHLGEDTEFGYRLAQAGALFVPEPRAGSWHLGRTHMMRRESQLQRYNRPFLADVMPQPRWLRKVGGSGWAVPLVTAVVDVGGQPLEVVRAAVDSILANDERDLRLCLVGPWDALSDDRRAVLDDAALDLRLIAATYRSDPRVRLVERAPESAFPSPYLLTVPARHGLAASAVRRLVDEADRHQVGLVRVSLPSGGAVELWRTAAMGRARWIRRDGESIADAVADTHGSRELAGVAVGVLDLARIPPRRLAEGIVAATEGLRPAPWLPAAVEVAGLRSLGRATVLVMRLSAARARARARRVAGRWRRPGEDRHGT